MWKPVDGIENDGFFSGSGTDRVLVPFVQFRGDSHMVYYQSPFARSSANKDRQRAIITKARQTRYTGEMTDGAARRLKKSLSLLVQATRPRWIHNPVSGRMMLHTVSVVTLTIGSDDDPIISMAKAKEMLYDFMQWLYHTKGNRLRVWKAELQKRGQPHFHLVFPEFIHMDEIREKWNSIQRDYRTIDGYAARHKHFRPPSTEIKKAYQKGDIVGYLAKELSKETHAVKVQYWKQLREEIAAGDLPAMDKKEMKKEVSRRFEVEFGSTTEPGKIWDCSEVLSQTKYFTLALSHRQEDYFTNALENNLCERKDDADGWYYTIKWHDRPPPGFFTDDQESEYKDFLKVIIDRANGIEPEIPLSDHTNMKLVLDRLTGRYEWQPMQEEKPVEITKPFVIQTEISFEDGAKLFIDSGACQ